MTTALFVTPHQDDETLSMGSAVRNHLNAGIDVHVLLLTTGQNSGVRTEIGLDIPTFIAARDDELLRADRQNGVRTANIHIPADRQQDGQLTVTYATTQINNFLVAHPGAIVKCYSNLAATGRHVDHVTAGQAAVSLWKAGTITNLRLYVEPWLLSAFQTANPGVTVSPERVSDNTPVLRAFDQYALGDSTADTAGGFWGIGHRSVGAEFDAARPDPASYWHVPTN